MTLVERAGLWTEDRKAATREAERRMKAGEMSVVRLAFADQQYLIEHDFRANRRGQLLDLQFFAGGNLVLLAAGFYDRIHGGAPLVLPSFPRG